VFSPWQWPIAAEEAIFQIVVGDMLVEVAVVLAGVQILLKEVRVVLLSMMTAQRNSRVVSSVMGFSAPEITEVPMVVVVVTTWALGTTEAMAAGILAKVIGTLGDTTTTATITGRIMIDLRVVLMMVLKF
jgi:hypothetical protein